MKKEELINILKKRNVSDIEIDFLLNKTLSKKCVIYPKKTKLEELTIKTYGEIIKDKVENSLRLLLVVNNSDTQEDLELMEIYTHDDFIIITSFSEFKIF